MGKIKSFEDLNIWKEAHDFAIEIYEITKDFPREEIYGLTLQLKRAVPLFQPILPKEWVEIRRKNY